MGGGGVRAWPLKNNFFGEILFTASLRKTFVQGSLILSALVMIICVLDWNSKEGERF